VKWLIEHSTSHQLLWCIDSFVLPCLPAGREIRHCAKRQNVVCLESSNTRYFAWWMSAENYMEAQKWIGLPHRAVKSTVQTALCCIWGNSFVVNDKVKNGDSDLCR
jgi:hypothetical protein